jgi:hypothetical protein
MNLENLLVQKWFLKSRILNKALLSNISQSKSQSFRTLKIDNSESTMHAVPVLVGPQKAFPLDGEALFNLRFSI